MGPTFGHSAVEDGIVSNIAQGNQPYCTGKIILFVNEILRKDQ